MRDAVRNESPLVQQRPGQRVSLRERELLGYIIVRGRIDEPLFQSATTACLDGLELPHAPCTFATDGRLVACWMGPDEWMIITPSGDESEIMASLEKALADTHAAVVDVSGGNTTIALGGRNARDVLAKGCPLDLHPRAFTKGACAQTHIAHSGAMIRLVDDRPTFDIVVRRSFADYLWLWLNDAAAEYGAS